MGMVQVKEKTEQWKRTESKQNQVYIKYKIKSKKQIKI